MLSLGLGAAPALGGAGADEIALNIGKPAGGRAAPGAAAVVCAGFDDVRVYFLSFGDWVRDESCPVFRD